MRIIIDIIFVFFTTYIMIKSLKSIIKYESHSLFDFVILMLYLVQCFPVLCDLVFGYPEYAIYLSEFERALNNNIVALIYNIYISAAMFVLYFFSRHKVKTSKSQETERKIEDPESYMIPNFMLIILAVLPLVHILLSGNIMYYVIYGSATQRGISPDFSEDNMILVVIAIAALMIWYFRKNESILRTIAFVFLLFLNFWAGGKRYIVATAFFCFIYMFSTRRKSSKKKQVKLFLIIAALSCGIVVFSSIYLVGTRGISESWSNLYTTLRIDFGRDDVVKYTILHEFIDNESILEYPGQTVIGTLLMVVPRSIFPAKPYPHYRYLTASIYDMSILEIPSGMTPTFLEMSISNFGILGFIIAIAFVTWYCYVADKETNSTRKFLYAIVMLGFMTQSLDSMWPLFYLVLFFLLTRNVRFTIHGKGIRFR